MRAFAPNYSSGFFLLLGRIIVIFTSGASLIITARYVGADIFAKFGVLMILVNIVIDLVDFGSSANSSKDLASKTITKTQYFCTMKAKTIILFLVLLTSSPLMYGFKFSFLQILFTLIYSVLWIQVNYVQSLFLILGDYFHSILLSMLERILWLSVVFFTFFSLDKEVAFVLPMILGLLFHVLMAYRIIDIPRNSRADLFSAMKVFRQNSAYAAGSIATDLVTLDSNLVLAATNAASGGSYLLGQRFKNQLILGFVVFSIRIRNSFATKDKLAFYAILKKERYLIHCNTLAIFALLPITFYFADEIFGPTYPNVNGVLTLIFANAIFVGFSYLLFDILNFSGFAEKLRSQFIPLIPLQLSIIYFTALGFGVLGAALALSLIHI